MDRQLKTVIFITGLSFTLLVEEGTAAKLNKCVGENGRITFTQMGCPDSVSKKRIYVEPSPNSMDAMSNSAAKRLQKNARKRQKRKSISSGGTTTKKKCNLR